MIGILAFIGLVVIVYFLLGFIETITTWYFSKPKQKLDIVNGIAQRDLEAGELVTISRDDWVHIMNENERTH